MYGICMEDHGICMEHLGLRMEYVCNMDGILMEYVWNMYLTWMEYVWNMSRLYMEYVWNMPGMCMDYSWNMYGMYMESVWNMSGIWMAYVWNMHRMSWFSRVFDLGACQGTPWRPSQGGTQQNMKNHFWRPSFLPKFWANVGTFLAAFFTCFLRPLAFHLCAPAGRHMTQFRRLLATNLRTDWANQQKWRQWFLGESIKIKPFRTWNCASFLTFSYACCKPLFFVILNVFITFFWIWVPLWTPFCTRIGNNFNVIFVMIFWSKGDIKTGFGGGAPATHHR